MTWDELLADVLRRSQRASERKQDRSRRTEIQILNAALRVFSRTGISRSRIADVAAEAGISTSTLYEYYTSKEDIAYAVPMAHLGQFYEEYVEAVKGKSTAYDRALLFLSTSADFARRHPEWARLFYLEIWPSVLVTESEVSQSVGDYARILVFLVKQGIAEGTWSAEADPYETAAILIGGVNQVIITWLLYRRPKNLTKGGTAIAERTLSLLGATEECWAYDFPPYDGPWHKLSPFRGQRQRWVAFRFLGEDSEIDVANPAGGQPQEFFAWRWEHLDRLPRLVTPFKQGVYEKVVAAFAAFARTLDVAMIVPQVGIFPSSWPAWVR